MGVYTLKRCQHIVIVIIVSVSVLLILTITLFLLILLLLTTDCMLIGWFQLLKASYRLIN